MGKKRAKKKMVRAKSGKNKRSRNNTTTVVALLAGFVAAFVISYIGILFKAVGLRFLS